MEIKTKFNIGDKVFFFNPQKTGENAEKGEIARIEVRVGCYKKVEVTYFIDASPSSWVEEKHVFATKEEAIERILKSLK